MTFFLDREYEIMDSAWGWTDRSIMEAINQYCLDHDLMLPYDILDMNPRDLFDRYFSVVQQGDAENFFYTDQWSLDSEKLRQDAVDIYESRPSPSEIAEKARRVAELDPTPEKVASDKRKKSMLPTSQLCW